MCVRVLRALPPQRIAGFVTVRGALRALSRFAGRCGLCHCSQGIAGHVALTGETVLIADAYSDARFDRSIACVCVCVCVRVCACVGARARVCVCMCV